MPVVVTVESTVVAAVVLISAMMTIVASSIMVTILNLLNVASLRRGHSWQRHR